MMQSTQRSHRGAQSGEKQSTQKSHPKSPPQIAFRIATHAIANHMARTYKSHTLRFRIAVLAIQKCAFLARRENSKLTAAQEAVLADMVEDGQAGPENIVKRFKRDAVGKRNANRPSKAQVGSFKHNRKRSPKGSPAASPLRHSGQAPASPGTPVSPLDRVCTLYNYAASIKLPPVVSDMNREEMCDCN